MLSLNNINKVDCNNIIVYRRMLTGAIFFLVIKYREDKKQKIENHKK